MYFEALRSRLIAQVRGRVQRGEVTERRLGRLTGISQPHLHNILNGSRHLSPAMADLLLRQLQITVVDLLSANELAACTTAGGGGGNGRMEWESGTFRTRQIPVLEGYVGTGHPFPVIESSVQRYPFPVLNLAQFEDPAMTLLAADTHMSTVFGAGDLVLLDRATRQRTEFTPHALFAIDFGGEGSIRHVHSGPRHLYLIAEDSLNDPALWDSISLEDRNILDIVKARVVWIGRQLEQAAIGKKPTEEAG